MKRLIFYAAMLCFCASLVAQQTLDILTLSGRYGFPKAYDSLYDGKATEVTSMVNLVLPVKFNEKTIWYNSLNYFYFKVVL